MTHIDLFAGLGGFSLGAICSNIATIECVELNAFRRKELAKIHSSHTKIHDDINTWQPQQFADIVTMGFPCQDISAANATGKGLAGRRSGLFYQAWRKAMLLRPTYIVMENVSNLLNRGIHDLLTTIAQSGYSPEYSIVRASDFGLPHERERIYIIAHALQDRRAYIRISQSFQITAIPGTSSSPLVSLVAARRADGFADIAAIQRGDDVPNIRKYLAGLGDAVPPIIAHYFFECIKFHYSLHGNSIS